MQLGREQRHQGPSSLPHSVWSGDGERKNICGVIAGGKGAWGDAKGQMTFVLGFEEKIGP